MEKRKLQSMVDYVKNKNKPFESFSLIDFLEVRDKVLTSIDNYAKFLSMPLTLSMFVPTDEEGNILEACGCMSDKGCCKKEYEYQKALDNVIFKDAVVIDSTPYKSTKRFMINLNHPASFRIYNKFNFRDGYEEISFLPNFSKTPTVEYMVGYGLELTESAINKYQI